MAQVDAKTTTWRNAVYAAKFQNAPVPAVPAIYLALFTADPTAAGDLTNEATYTGYARQAMTVTNPTDGAGANAADVLFPECTANGQTISHVGIMDDPTAGAGIMIDHIALNVPVPVTIGQSPLLPAGAGALAEK